MPRVSSVLLALAMGTIAASAHAHLLSKPPLPTGRCGPLGNAITATTPSSSPQLFILTTHGWHEVAYSPFGTDLSIDSYRGGQLSFIYVVPPSTVQARQFLSIRTTADTTMPDHFVNLRRGREDFDTAYYATYQGYHLSGEPSGTLRRFHTWKGDRSDVPMETRKSWAFTTNNPVARHRVLAISYQASSGVTCLPFFLGPNIASPSVDLEGDDQITILKDFSVEITEAKTAAGTPGRTFKISSPPSKVQ